MFKPVRRGIIALPFALTIYIAPVSAEELNCSAYATKAVAQNQQNQDMDCGFEGGAWLSDFDAHFNWCRTTNMAGLTTEDNARAAALKSCVVDHKDTEKAEEAERAAAEAERVAAEAAQRQKIDSCQSYARNAVEQQAINASRQCGFSGGGWSADYAPHFEWCLKADAAASNSEAQARDNQIVGCKSAQQSSNEARCNDYAAIAVAQNDSNESRQCKFEGGPWSSNFKAHKNWCLKKSSAAAEKQNDSRAKDLDENCGKTVCKSKVSWRGVRQVRTTKCSWVPNP